MEKIILNLFTLTLVISSYGFERGYVKRAVLTKEQEKVVVALAQKCGIEKVAKISTHNMYPSPFRGIRVQGAKLVKGREVSFQVLSVSHGERLQPEAKPRKGQVRMGNFWAGKPYTRKQTILKVGKKEYRAGSVQEITIKEYETILDFFLAGEYEHGPAVNGKSLNQVDWAKPSRFAKRGGAISVRFPHKNAG